MVLDSRASGNDDDDSPLDSDSDDTLESDTDFLDEEFNTHNHYDMDSVSGLYKFVPYCCYCSYYFRLIRIRLFPLII